MTTKKLLLIFIFSAFIAKGFIHIGTTFSAKIVTNKQSSLEDRPNSTLDHIDSFESDIRNTHLKTPELNLNKQSKTKHAKFRKKTNSGPSYLAKISISKDDLIGHADENLEIQNDLDSVTQEEEETYQEEDFYQEEQAEDFEEGENMNPTPISKCDQLEQLENTDDDFLSDTNDLDQLAFECEQEKESEETPKTQSNKVEKTNQPTKLKQNQDNEFSHSKTLSSSSVHITKFVPHIEEIKAPTASLQKPSQQKPSRTLNTIQSESDLIESLSNNLDQNNIHILRSISLYSGNDTNADRAYDILYSQYANNIENIHLLYPLISDQYNSDENNLTIDLVLLSIKNADVDNNPLSEDVLSKVNSAKEYLSGLEIQNTNLDELIATIDDIGQYPSTITI